MIWVQAIRGRGHVAQGRVLAMVHRSGYTTERGATKAGVSGDRIFLAFSLHSSSSLRSSRAHTRPQPTISTVPSSLVLWRTIPETPSRASTCNVPGTKVRRRESAGNTRIRPFGMVPSRLPDLPPEIWEYILHFVPEPAIYDIKLVSRLFHVGGWRRGGVERKTKSNNLLS